MSKSKPKAQVLHFDLFGKRDDKYNFLLNNSLDSIEWNVLQPDEPNYFFVKKGFEGKEKYFNWIDLGKLFNANITGIKTHDDKNLVSFEPFTENNHKYEYRPLDIRYINYDLKKVVRHRYSVMKHMKSSNICLIIPRQAVTTNWTHVQVSKHLSDNRIHYSNKGIPIVCPLYLYPESSTQQEINRNCNRQPNLNPEIVQQIADGLGLAFTNEKDTLTVSASTNTFAPIDILDYIYAVLHSPTYRERYKEFLKIDFPRVPYPNDKNTFWQLVKLGGELRQIHLLEHPKVDKRITTYPMAGSNIVDKPRFEDGRVWINPEQYFDGVPQVAWDFYIGGYQPAQKWLKDRKSRELTFEDILHYQKIIVALTETDRLMKEIDGVGEEW